MVFDVGRISSQHRLTSQHRTTCGLFSASPLPGQAPPVNSAQDNRGGGDTVSTGPFHELPPLELWQRLAPLPDGRFRSGDEVRSCAQAWLRTVLEEAGVELGDYDQAVIGIVAKDCVSTVQVIAGWIRRARTGS